MSSLNALMYSQNDDGTVREPPQVILVDGNPDLILEAPQGSVAINPATGAVYVKTDTDTVSWQPLADFIEGSTLDELPDGSSVAVDTDLVLIQHDPTGTKAAMKLTIAQLRTVMGL